MRHSAKVLAAKALASPVHVKALRTALRLKGSCNWASNCWGMTLFLLGGQKSLRYVEHADLDDWISLSCVRVKGRLRFGDILAIRYGEGRYCECGMDSCEDGEYNLEHSAIYVGGGRYLHQAGFGGPIEVATLAQIRRKYTGNIVEYFRA